MSDGMDARSTRRDDCRTLGLLPAASSQEILQAYLKLRRALRADSPALRTAATDEERRAMLQRVEEAYLRLCPQAGMPTQPEADEGRIRPRAVPPRTRAAAGPSAFAGSTPSAWENEPAASADEPRPDFTRPSAFRARPSLPLS
jgi:hypothetical protein